MSLKYKLMQNNPKMANRQKNKQNEQLTCKSFVLEWWHHKLSKSAAVSDNIGKLDSELDCVPAQNKICFKVMLVAQVALYFGFRPLISSA